MKLHKNPFFYISLILTGLLSWQIALIVQAQNYISPPGPPPNMAGVGGIFWRATSSGIYYDSGSVGIGTTNPTSAVKLHIENGPLMISSGAPKILFKESDSSVGQIYFANGKLFAQAPQSQNGQPFEIGSGGGDSFWQISPTRNGIVYLSSDKPNVLISDVFPTYTTTTGWWYIYESSSKTGIKLFCDLSPDDSECGQFVEVGDDGGKYSYGYDEFCAEWQGGEGGPLFCAKRRYAIFEYKRKVELVWNEGQNTAKLTVGDIDLVNPSWNIVGDVQSAGDGDTLSQVIIDKWAMCPPGQFVVGVRFGKEPTGRAVPVVKCAKW